MTNTADDPIARSAPKGGGKKLLIGVIVVLVLVVAGLGMSSTATAAGKHQCPSWYPKGSVCKTAQDAVAPASATHSGRSAVLSVLPAYFSNGCNAGCSDTTVPRSAFTAKVDPNNSNWIEWILQDKTMGAASGYAEYITGTWQIVAGPGSADVGCGTVPTTVMAAFGQSCSGGSSSETTPTSSATTAQLNSAYQAGLFRGEHIPTTYVAAMELGRWGTQNCENYAGAYSNSAEASEFDQGCIIGFNSAN
jgi:hypothetical protein